MPYIRMQDRLELSKTERPLNVGELTYVLYDQAVRYGRDTVDSYPPMGTRYSRHAEVIAALECEKLEYYRCHVAPYEDLKIEENGDV